MNTLLIPIIISVFGIILTALLTAVTFYFKNINTNVTNMSTAMIEMNIKLEVLITKHDNTEEEARANSFSIVSLRERMHSAEDALKQVLHFIEEYAKSN
jgi:hypothetical protein